MPAGRMKTAKLKMRFSAMRMMKISFCFLYFLLGGLTMHGQINGYTTIDGQVVPFTVDDCGDTLLLASLENVSVSSPRLFANRDEYNRYRKYRRYAAKVYPYAVEAVRLFREVEDATGDLKKRKRKKYIRELHQELKDEFQDPLKKLTKTQGKILVKMIEKEIDTPMYDLIKNMRNGFTAFKWNLVGGLNGYSLKDGYIRGEDHILDMVLDDFDISAEDP